MANKNIESVLLEERRFKPSARFVGQAGLKARDLQALLATWTGVCSVCGQRIDTHPRAPT